MRKGELQVASMKAQEWLCWAVLADGDDKKKQFGFALETMLPTPSPAQPCIHLELGSGQPDSKGGQLANSLSDTDDTALRAFVSRSIRSLLPQTMRNAQSSRLTTAFLWSGRFRSAEMQWPVSAKIT